MTFKVKTKGQNEGEKLLEPQLRFKEFKNKIANPVPRVSIKKLQKEVEADGIVIQRGKEKHESK